MSAAPHESAATGPVCPIPPRYWWLRRILALTVAWIAFLVGVRLWWGWEADRRWEAAIARYRAAGQPALRADFAGAPISDEDNAAAYLRTAIEIMRNSQPGATPVGPLREDAVILTVADEREILELVRRACACERADWGEEYQRLESTELSDLRALGQMLADMMGSEWRCGDGRAVIERAHDMLGLAEQTSAFGPLMPVEFVRIRTEALLCWRLQQALPVIRAGLAEAKSESECVPASRAQITTLMSSLLDERGCQDYWQRAMHGERMRMLELASDPRRGILPLLVSSWFLETCGFNMKLTYHRLAVALTSPIWTLFCVRAADVMTVFGEAVAAPSLPSASRPLHASQSADWSLRGLPYTLSVFAVPAVTPSGLSTMFGALAQRRMAATALAMCLYEADHGRRPAALAELVPAYLPAVPVDPFSPADRPICYRTDGDAPRLYSVGLNGVDDGGRYELASGGGIGPDSLDYPLFFLNGTGAPPAPH
jgi:hypothetical protein